jgi:CheY-like chemotaxis protein
MQTEASSRADTGMALGTILLAEDNPDDVLLMQTLMRNCCVLNPLQVVSNGDQAIAYLKGTGSYANRAFFPVPILFLLDLKMPGKGGLDVLRWLQTQPKPAFPTIVLTGFSVMKPIEERDFLPLIIGFDGIKIAPSR